MRKKTLFGLVIAGLLFFSVQVSGQNYYSGSFARLNYVQGDVRVNRGQELGVEAGEVNFILTAGDQVITEDGLAEISFGQNNYLRIDRYSHVEMFRLPESTYEDLSVHLYGGKFYFRVSSLTREKAFSLHTPDASFYVLEEGLYRFEVNEQGRTEAMALEGSLEVSGMDKSLMLAEGDSVVAEEGYLVDYDQYYLAGDEFDRWNQGRDQLLARANYGYSSHLPEEIREYEPELSSHGRWVYERPYGYVWVPVVTYADWRPYLYGRWVWYPRIGWTWVSAEPWGWAVYHYGRWHWRLGLGWYWIPTVHWGPAWVHWYWDANFVAWCPLSYWNRPVVIVNNHFYDRYYDHYYPVNSRALVIIKKNQLQAHHTVRNLVRPEQLRGVEKIRLEARQPQIKPVTNTSLKAPALRSGNSVIREHNSSNLKRISSSSLKSNQGNSTTQKVTSGVTQDRLSRPSSTRLKQNQINREIKPYAPSRSVSGARSNSQVGSSGVNSDGISSRVTSENLRPGANPDNNRSRLNQDRYPARLSPENTNRSNLGSNNRNSPIIKKDNLSQPQLNNNQNTRKISERPAVTVRQKNISSQSEDRRQSLQSRPASQSSIRTNLNRNYQQSAPATSRSRSVLQKQVKKSSYNLPSLSRPYQVPAVKNASHPNKNSTVSLSRSSKTQSAQSRSSSSSRASSSKSVNKKKD